MHERVDVEVSNLSAHNSKEKNEMVARALYAEHVEKWCEAIANQDYQFGPQAETA